MAFRGIRLLSVVPKLDYFRFHKLCFAISIILCVLSIVSLATRGLNYGVDFAGGILIEARKATPIDMPDIRAKMNNLNLGDISLQEFGRPTDFLLRIQSQGDEKAEMAAVQKVRDTLGSEYSYERVEVVGPRVGKELIRDGILAVTLSLVGIMIYMWFRFGWRAGAAGVVAIFHDCLTTVGLFSILNLQFDLNTVAAVVTIAGFSINDTVVIDDRIRENTRLYKSMDFRELINLSVNQTMARTVMTNGLVLLATVALLVFGGQLLFGLSFALLWGVVAGTYSTVYVAAPLEWYLASRGRAHHGAHAEEAATRP